MPISKGTKLENPRRSRPAKRRSRWVSWAVIERQLRTLPSWAWS